MATSSTTDERGRNASDQATQHGATSRAEPRAAHTDHAADTSAPASTGLLHKKSGRGMSLRRRIGLKIEADESDGRSHTETKPHGLATAPSTNGGDKEAQLRPLGLTTGDANDGHQHASGSAAAVEEWWKVEYRAPPPGHLGAHAIARDDGGVHKSRNPVDTAERRLERMDVATANATTASAPLVGKPTPSSSSALASSSSERPHLHETPERARKIRGGSELYDTATSHSSPNPKRKIMDLQDVEAGMFPSMGVAKELKRFHESSDEQLYIAGESELGRTLRTAVVTPSKLLRPMKKIDIQAGSSAPSSSAPPEKASASVKAKAPESA